MGSHLREVVKLGLAAADRAGVLDSALQLRSRFGPGRVSVLCHHRIHGAGPENDDLRRLCSATPEELDRQMEVVSRHFRAITLSELSRLLERPQELPPNLMAVTFDDGYRDNYEVAAPIMARYGVRGTFFVVSGYPGGQVVSWIDRLAYALCHSTAAEIDLPSIGVRLTRDDCATPHAAADLVAERLKRTPWPQVAGVLDRLEEQARAALPVERFRQLVMEPVHLRRLAADGMEIGNHSRGHSVLNQIADAAQLQQEVARARHELEEMAGAAVVSFAYPHGHGFFGEAAVKVVQDSGHRFAVDVAQGDHGANWSGRMDRFRMRRMMVGLHNPIAGFKARMAFADLLPFGIS